MWLINGLTKALSGLIKSARILPLLICMCLIACGGGSGGSSNIAQSSSVASSTITISGQVTYDFVPYSELHNGLDYSATQIKPVRRAVVELLDANNVLLIAGSTDDQGSYSLNVELNKIVKVRIKAQLLKSQTPSWNFKVTDNTNGNRLYAIDGSLIAANSDTAVRNLHAASGWTNTGYTQPRAAAPFAILDSVLTGADRLIAAGNTKDFSPLELRWSALNKAADGEITLGEIGTSYYKDSVVYILGDANNDTDEYDRHVILHEWGHYIEYSFSRSDSLGGDHAYGEKLDMRVALSEGFANAFSAMMLDNPEYRDTSGFQQTDGFVRNLSHKNHAVRGWYSEASIQSVLYNYYNDIAEAKLQSITDILNVISSENYFNTDAILSVYVFADELRHQSPVRAETLNSLLMGQNIAITDTFGEGESNSGGYPGALPIYKTVSINGPSTNVCSTNHLGSFNKLAVAQFLKLDVSAQGNYKITVQESGDDSGESDPDIYLYQQGRLVGKAESSMVDGESLVSDLIVGTYIVELVDYRAVDSEYNQAVTACFDVLVQQVN
ncbi:hypothetical protein [Cellvibrio sp. NN19]|uniref:hypothetical protein n=1 Tax=Cellvibrio chitinivorans TaxID=3102792 RepID=UPI002B409750|nr:hypothetical protein [Cellvibrio sp. NN19]